MENRLIKIYKSATKVSIMDIIDALDYHRFNNKNEEVYRGNIMFVINEYGTSRNQETAYLTKAAAKAIFYSILNHHFPKLYSKEPFSEFGGTNKNGVVRSRILSIEYEQPKNRYKFQIDEGPGRLDNNGTIKMVKKEKSVRTYVEYENAIKLAHEVYTYINQAEIAAMLKGKPYYTNIPDFRNNSNNNNYNNGDSPENNDYYPGQDVIAQNDNQEDVYIIKIGKYTGTPISQIDTNTLETVVAKLVPETPELAELLEEAKKELGKRY